MASNEELEHKSGSWTVR